MADPHYRRWLRRFDWAGLESRGLSCRRLTRKEVALAFPGVRISPWYGKARADELSAVIATGSPTEKPATAKGQRRHRDTNIRRRAV
jgi:hypothetical protein